MKKRTILGILVACVLLVAGGPSVSQAININTVTVDIAGSQFAGPFSLAGWNLPQALNPGDSLILTQTAASPFNFDTSDLNCLVIPAGGGANIGCKPTPTVTVNGTLFTDTSKVLTFGGNDDSTSSTNQSHEWLQIGSTADFAVFVGYADTAHSNACADTSGNCKPDPFAASGGVLFEGAGTTSDSCSANHGGSPCFDAGAIMIVAAIHTTPEPSTLLLLGTGVIGVAVWGRKRLMAK
jgi:hypothetical protein